LIASLIKAPHSRFEGTIHKKNPRRGRGRRNYRAAPVWGRSYGR